MIQKRALINDLPYLKSGSLQPGTISVRVLSKRLNAFVIVAHFAQSYYYPKSNYGVQINESGVIRLNM